MSLEIEAIYENGVFKPDGALPLQNGQRVKLIVERTESKLIQWKGTVEDLEYLAESDENHVWASEE